MNIIKLQFLMVQGMQDQLMDFVEESTEIQESLGRTYNVPDYIDEDELLSGKSRYPPIFPSFKFQVLPSNNFLPLNIF